MPVDISGWIEIQDPSNKRWKAVKNLSPLLIPADIDSNCLFGISKRRHVKPIFGDRGLPSDVSAAVVEELDEYRKFAKIENNFSFDELFGFSYFTCSEVNQFKIESILSESSPWLAVLREFQLLLKQGAEPTEVRVVVWALC